MSKEEGRRRPSIKKRLAFSLLFTLIMMNVADSIDGQYGAQIGNGVTEHEQNQLEVMLQQLGIIYDGEIVSKEDRETWSDQVFMSGSSLDFPIERLWQLQTFVDSTSFFPKEYWKQRRRDGNLLKVLPIIFPGNKNTEQSYLYRGDKKEDRLLLNLYESPSQHYIKYFATVMIDMLDSQEVFINDMTRRMVEAQIHVLFARNTQKSQQLIIALGEENNLSPYYSIGCVVQFLTNRKTQLNIQEQKAIASFLDDVTRSPAGTYTRLYQDLHLSNDAISEVDVAKKFFGWDKTVKE